MKIFYINFQKSKIVFDNQEENDNFCKYIKSVLDKICDCNNTEHHTKMVNLAIYMVRNRDTCELPNDILSVILSEMNDNIEFDKLIGG